MSERRVERRCLKDGWSGAEVSETRVERRYLKDGVERGYLKE